ncbi:hypothetical protein [Streptomyces boninensis]|uniref:hypothetical protein n=1 Tax=Streptomyces boninensis TaxID=2039455 RepID=UPI003B21DFF7
MTAEEQIAAAVARRANRARQRAELDQARQPGLAARHRAKLNRAAPDHTPQPPGRGVTLLEATMATGRSNETRTVTLTTTSASTAITAGSGTFSAADVGRTVDAGGVPAGTTIATVTNGTTAALSANATASGSRTAVLSPAPSAGFTGWSPETAAESDDYTVAASIAGVVPADVITDNHTQVSQRARG